MATTHSHMHFIGNAQYVSAGSRMVFSNGFEFQISGNRGRVLITDPNSASAGLSLNLRHPMELWLLRTLMGMMQDLHGTITLPVEREFRGEVCPGCAGTGGWEDRDGNWRECEECGEDGMV